MIVITGAPLEWRARGNCPRCSPLNPALGVDLSRTGPTHAFRFDWFVSLESQNGGDSLSIQAWCV